MGKRANEIIDFFTYPLFKREDAPTGAIDGFTN
jgi:hypothetical protein